MGSGARGRKVKAETHIEFGDSCEFIEIDPSEWEEYLDAQESERGLKAIRRLNTESKFTDDKPMPDVVFFIKAYQHRRENPSEQVYRQEDES